MPMHSLQSPEHPSPERGLPAEPLTVLLVDHGAGLGGAELCLLELAHGLDRGRFRPVVVCGPGPLEAAAAARGLTTRPVRFPAIRRRPGRLPALFGAARALARWARREGAAILHGNTTRACPAVALAAAGTGTPWVWHAHDLYGPGCAGGRSYPWLMSRSAAAVVAPSRAIARTIPCAGVRVVPNGVDLVRYDPDRDRRAARAALGLASGGPLIGTVGRLNPVKGHHLFVEAAARLRDRLPGARFVIVGGPVFPDESEAYGIELRARARAEGLADRLHFAGHQPEVAEWLAAMDVFVQSARGEPFGRVIVEAMAAGRPVVAFREGGAPEIVAHGETGLLAPPGDVGALADSIAELASDPARAERTGRLGRARAAALFTTTAYVRGLENAYLAAAAGRAR